MKITGKIRHKQGISLGRVQVIAYDKDLRSAQKLGEAFTAADGSYSIEYTRAQFCRAEKRSADVFIEVHPRHSGRCVKSSVHYNVTDTHRIDLTLDAEFLGESEFTRLWKDVTRLVEAEELDIRELEDSEEHQDIQFLAAELEEDPQHIIHLVLAHRLQHASKLPAEFFYGLTRVGALRSFAMDRPHALRLVLDLDADIDALLDEVILLPKESILKAVDQAVQRGIVSPPLRSEIPEILKHLKWQETEAHTRDQERAKDGLETLLKPALSEQGKKALSEIFSQDHRGDISHLLKRLDGVSSQKDGTLDPEASKRLQRTQTLISKSTWLQDIKGRLRVDSEEEVRKWSALDAHAWENALKASRVSAAGDEPTLDEKEIKNEATRLADEFRSFYPSSSFLLRLSRTKEAAPFSEVLQSVADELPEIDLPSTNIHALLREGKLAQTVQKKGKAAVTDAVKKAQRLFKLTRSEDKARALLSEDFHSAQSIAKLSAEAFSSKMKSKHDLDDASLKQIHSKAVQIHNGSVLLAGELKALSGSLESATMSSALEASTMEAMVADFPNLKSLFQGQDLCECQHCRSVLGPAAYLADALQFLGDRQVVDTTISGGGPARTARSALQARCPQVFDLELNCPNALVPLPYIDIVNERLGDLIAPDPGFVFAGTVTAGAAPEQLLAAVQVEGLPLGTPATISGPFSGNYSLRGPEASYLMTPEGGDFRLRRTHQTHGTEQERAAAPEYENQAALSVVESTPIAFELPFDAAHTGVNAYLQRFDTRRSDVMRGLTQGASPSPLSIAAQELGLTLRVATLITSADPTGQDEYWNAPEGTAVSTLKNVGTFLDRTALEYRKLENVDAPDAEDGGLLRQPFINPDDALFIRHLDSSCDTSRKEIEGLDTSALDRIHRFLRLGRATGLPYAYLNLAIRHQGGSGQLDSSALVRLGHVFRLARRTKSPVESLLLFYGWGVDGWPMSRWAQIFANPANGPEVTDLTARRVSLNESRPPATQERIAVHLGALALSLRRAPRDIEQLAALLPDDILNFGNLAQLYGLSAIAQISKLNVPSFAALVRISGITPTNSPTDTWRFLDLADLLATTTINPGALERLLSPPPTADARLLTQAKALEILEELQNQLAQAHSSTRSNVDSSQDPALNTPLLLQQLGQLNGMAPESLRRIEALARGRWVITDETAPNFLNRVFSGVLSTSAVISIQTAWATVPGGDPDGKLAERNAFIASIATGVSETLYARARTALAVAILVKHLGMEEANASIVLEQAHLKAVPSVAALPLLDVFADETLTAPDALGNLPAITPATFPHALSALQLSAAVQRGIELFRMDARSLDWLLRHAVSGGFIELDRLPHASTSSASNPAPALKWLRLQQLEKDFPAILDPRKPGETLSLLQLIELALQPSTTPTQFFSALSFFTGWDQAELLALDGHFGHSTAGLHRYADPAVWRGLAQVFAHLGRLGVTVAQAQGLIQDPLTDTQVAVIRSSLRLRYDEKAWLNVQKSIEDELRQKKRDAFIAYLLATDPRFSTAADLFDHLLITVDMGACQITSRIVQAHGTVQLFAQRCLLGLEPKTAADTTTDPGWKRWSWMSAYRVWEANRRVFLYPENWLEPELRDDKSSFFVELERELAQSELTERSAENAAANYLEKLDEVAYLEHRACHYDPLLCTLHVFARTRGGDPAAYYHREFVKERFWTPWTKVDLDISADHLVAFIRNRRLYLAWPVFEEEAEMTTQSEGIPIPENGGEDAPPPNKRYKIKLAISEYSNDKWLPKKLSKEGLVSGSFSSTLPDRALYRFFAADVGGAGFSILVTINEPEGHDSYFGSFSITGCKGYPEPRSSTGYRNFGLSPIFKDTVLRSNRSTEQGADDENDFAVLYMLNAFNEQTIFRNTPDGNAPNNTSSPLPASRGATFKITYPWQMTGVDQFLSIPVSFSLSLTKIELPYPVPLGTFLPFLFEDNSRVFSITPGYFPRDRAKSEPARTASDLIPLFERFWNHALFINKQINGVIPFPYLLLLLFVLDSELRKQLTPSSDQSFGYRVEIANHPLVCFFRQTLNQGGLTALLNRATQQEVTESSFDRPDSYAPGPSVAGDYPIENVDFRKRGAYSIYNWELFFHLPFLVAVKLSRDQKFEEAMRWFHFIFDPTGSQPGTAPQKYWVTAPFFERQAPEYTAQRIENLLYQVAQDPSGETIQGLAQAIEEWHDAPFRPHVVARSRTVAFQKAVFARYIENLIAWGDFYFRQDTMESLVQADQLYLLAEKLCGPRPRLVPPVAPPPSRSFNELVDDLDLFSNALLELEDLVPEPSDLPHAGDELPSAPASLTSLYFCIPPNEKLFEYWDIIDDRRFKITHCKTISGADRSMALFAPRIDPAQLVRATAQGISPGAVLASLGAPLPPYRYVLMVQKAIDLTQELRTLGKELEAALERRDGEAMARLRSTLEIELLDKVTELKDAQIREATGQVTAVELSKATVEERRSYYSSREKVSELEAVSLLLQGLSGISQGVSGALSAAAGVVNLLPNFNIGMAGFGGSPNVTVTWGSSNVAGGLSSFAQAAGSLAGTLGTAGGMVGTIAGYQRRKEEWEFQETLAARELTQLDQQMAVARIREEITKKDRVNHGKQIENARSADQFMRSKFTNQELFDWMSGEISAIYFGAYELAFAMAKRAERCFQHELGSTQSFIQRSTFDHQRKGIGCANQLMSQIRQMESAYYEQNRREYELEKDISLAILDPIALLHLKEGRKCTIVIPEAIFDLDHCGHYFRRIKSVSISIPCVAGPFTTIPCKLTLLSNRYRHSPIAANASSYAEDPGQDERFVYNTGGIQMIATSRGHADAGTFELNLRDERYLPFEGCGAISTWQIEFGSPVATFDEQSITDAIIHLKYTARDGGSGLKAVAEDALKDLINEVRNQMGGNGLVRVLNLRREAPDAWVRLTQEGAASFDVEQEFFPYFASNNGLELAEAWLLFRSRGANSTFPFTLEGTSDTATLGTHVDGLFSAALPSPLPMGIGSSFSLSSTQAEELTDLYLVARYQLT